MQKLNSKQASLVDDVEKKKLSEEDDEDESDDYQPRRLSSVFKGISKTKLNLLKRAIISKYELISHKKEIREEDEGCLGQIIDIIDIPFNIIRRYTILPCDEEEYNHHYAIYWPFLGILFFCVMFLEKPSLWWLLIIPIAFVAHYFLK